MLAKQEWTIFIYVAYATILFLVPAALTSAELGSAFSRSDGGVYTWVSRALSPFWGTVAVLMQWAQSMSLYPILLGFGGIAFAYLFNLDYLVNNGLYLGLFSIVVYWLATLINLKGHNLMVKVANWAFLVGILGSVAILIVLAAIWLFSGQRIGLSSLNAAETSVATVVAGHTQARVLPLLGNLNDIAFLAAIILLFAGVEVQTVHARQLRRPERDLPKAILLASALVFAMFLFGGLAVAVIVPFPQLTVDGGIFRDYQLFADHFHLRWLVNVLSGLIAFGMLGEVLPWIGGPSEGLFTAAREGNLPRQLVKRNRNDVPTRIIIIQGIIVSLVAGIYLVFPNPNVGFFFLTTFTVGLYLLMYLLMYLAVIVLPYRLPNLVKPFSIPGGKTGSWVVGGVGFLAAGFAFVVSFFPPVTLTAGNPTTYVGLAMGGTVATLLLTVVLYLIARKQARQT